MNIEIKVKKLYPDAILPKYLHEGDGAMDVFAENINITEKYIEYGTGLAFEIPKGYVMLIFPRSSITSKDLMLKNSVGVLDSGYRGELRLRFQKNGEDIYNIGDRIGQIMVLNYPEMELREVNELEDSSRGKNGFGSSGKN